MPAERAGYTVTMFVIDVSPTMGKIREIELPSADGETRITKMTNLQWSLQYVMYKIQEMIFHGRKTDQCGVVLFGSEKTDNIVNKKHGGYENVSVYIPIAQPGAHTLAKLAALEASSLVGDPIEGLIAAIEEQASYLSSKPSWTKKMVLVTDGESPLELEGWEATADKLKQLNVSLAILGVDFDDEDIEFKEQDKPHIKEQNEAFWHEFAELADAIVGTCAFALQEVSRPEPKETKSAALGYTLRLGDPDENPITSLEIPVKVTKGTAAVRPPSMKKFWLRKKEDEASQDVDAEGHDYYGPVSRSTEYINQDAWEKVMDDAEGSKKSDREIYEEAKTAKLIPPIGKETLTRSYRYGSAYIDAEGELEKVSSVQGIDICAFFPTSNIRRELLMSEVQFVWGDPASGKAQVAFSSLVQAMYQKDLVAVARWTSRNNGDPKMGLLTPRVWEDIDSLTWVQLPFADDVRKYSFRSLERIISKTGETLAVHPYLPTSAQMDAMDDFVDNMDLMQAGPKDEDGERQPWYDPSASYNPAVHRIKQALFHAAIVPDLTNHPVPPPHEELTKYFSPPSRVLKRAQESLERCITVFNAAPVVKRTLKRKVERHVEGTGGEDDFILPPSAKFARLEGEDTMDVDQLESQTLEVETPDLPPRNEQPAKKTTAPSVQRTGSPELVIDSGAAPGRIIGANFPLEDFKRNIKGGDLVSKAVEDLFWVVQDILLKPFAKRRHAELLDCLRELRAVCLNEDEIEAWNESIREIKDVSTSSSAPNNPAFWKELQTEGRALGLITKSEAAKRGGKSGVSDTAADKFLR